MTLIVNTVVTGTIETAAGGPVALTGQSPAKAWVSGTSSAVVSDSLNISGGIDSGTGDYNYAFSNSFSTALYGVSSCGRGNANTNVCSGAQASGSIDLRLYSVNNDTTDQPNSVAIFGDLA